MVTHQITLNLRADSSAIFTHQVNKSILPLLRLQNGFCQEITIIAPDRLTTILESHWDTTENASAFNRTGYLEVLIVLSEMVTTIPKSRILNLVNSTTCSRIEQIAA